MKAVKRRTQWKLVLTLFSIAADIVVAAQSPLDRQSDSPRVRVLVLDALDGKPQSGVHVWYLCNEIPHGTNTFVVTDKTGIADVPFTCSPGNEIELNAIPKTGKEGCGGGVAATLQEIESSGVISKPDSAGGIWCPPKISRKLTPIPGQVTLFVKKPTWWQSHVAG